MRRNSLAGLGLLVVLAGSALGQEAPAPPEKRPPLQGPPVKETRAPHTDDQFTDGMRPQGRMGPQIPMRAYTEVVGKLRGESAPEGLRLSEEQEAKLGEIEKEFREAARNRPRGEGEGRRRPDDKPSEGQLQPDAPQRRRDAQEMTRNGPRPSDYQTRIWAVLNEKQQAYVKVELDKVREELQKRRGENEMQRRIAQQNGRPGQPGRPAANDGEATPTRERAMRLVRRIAQMPEEDRDRLIRRIEEELDRRGIPDAPPESDRPPAPPEPRKP